MPCNGDVLITWDLPSQQIFIQSKYVNNRHNGYCSINNVEHKQWVLFNLQCRFRQTVQILLRLKLIPASSPCLILYCHIMNESNNILNYIDHMTDTWSVPKSPTLSNISPSCWDVNSFWWHFMKGFVGHGDCNDLKYIWLCCTHFLYVSHLKRNKRTGFIRMG